ncbi:MerR family transcriptional regulator [bacterium]|nr:MerR family transcriptional regulator [bacterium]
MAIKTQLKIGELSKIAGVTPRTIRFYVQEGLLPQPERKQKNLALYGADCVEKIQAIRKAQNERFLPLVVIRQILEQNRFDYSALCDVDVPTFSTGSQQADVDISVPEIGEPDIPEEIVVSLKKKKLIQTSEKRTGDIIYSGDDRRLVTLLSALHNNGLSWDELLTSLDTIQGLVENIAELECRALLSGVMNNPTGDFQNLLQLEEKTLQSFINKVRRHTLKNIMVRYQNDLDYAFLASADEGYAVQADKILPILQTMESTLKPRSKDKRLLNDLALGYSCLGNLEDSLRYLQRIRRFSPDDLETQLRWIWYQRFTRRQQDQKRLREKMDKLVADNPDYAMGRAFMAIWYAFDTLETDDPYEILRLTNRCLQEIEAADRHLPEDLHEWTLIHYIKGRFFGRMQAVPGSLENGIAAFECIRDRQSELDKYYATQKPFFSQWLWPNIHLFLGIFYNQAGRFEEALKVLFHGREFKMLPPYQERLEKEIETAHFHEDKC